MLDCVDTHRMDVANLEEDVRQLWSVNVGNTVTHGDTPLTGVCVCVHVCVRVCVCLWCVHVREQVMYV